MSTPVTLGQPPEIEYPDSDGQPMSDNTLQFQWIVTLQGNLDALFRHDPNVFVAGDLLWYPVEGHPEICAAPDALVALGRPKGYHGSYRQWEEGGLAPQVVFEVLSPGNRPAAMDLKFQFYDTYGVEEYYVYDPDQVVLTGWRRVGDRLQPIPVPHNWVSPRLQIRFDLSGPELVIYDPEGEPFRPFLKVFEQWRAERQQREWAEQQAREEQRQRQQAEQRAQQEQQRREQAEQYARAEQRQRQQAEQRAALAEQHIRLLMDRLRAAGIDADAPPETPPSA